MTKQPTEQTTPTTNKKFYWKRDKKPRIGFNQKELVTVLFTTDELSDMQTALQQNKVDGRMCDLTPLHDYIYFVLTGREVEKPIKQTVAVADKTAAELRAFAYGLVKSGKTSQEIVVKMLTDGFTEAQIKTAFSNPTATVDDINAKADALLKSLNIGKL